MSLNIPLFISLNEGCEKDMKLRKLPILFMFTLLVTTLCFATLLPLARAEEQQDPYVWIEDLDDDTEDYFESPGETVRIWTYSSSVPYTVTIYRTDPGQSYGTGKPPPGVTWYRVESYVVSVRGWQHYDFSNTVPGGTWWKAEISGASGTFFVIPEVPLGIIVALVACFASLGVRRLRSIRGVQ